MQYKKFIRLIDIPFILYPDFDICIYDKAEVDKFLSAIVKGEENEMKEKIYKYEHLEMARNIFKIVERLFSECLIWGQYKGIDKPIPPSEHYTTVFEFNRRIGHKIFNEYLETSTFEILHHIEVTKSSVVKWLLECGEIEQAKIFDPSISNPRKELITENHVESELPTAITHTSELLEVMNSAIIEHWEGLTEYDARPKNEVVQAWILLQYQDVSKSMAKNIASIIRPNKYK